MTPDPGAPRWVRVLFALVALAFVITAGIHLARGIAPPPGDDAAAARHALFVAINLAAAAGVLLRPRWFAAPFALLVLQQLGSHGGRAVATAQAGAVPGAEDLAVVLFMPLVLGALVWDARRGSSGRPEVSAQSG